MKAVCAGLVFATCLSSALYAQGPSALPPTPTNCAGANCVAIRSTGGFLGYLDGFPEFPGWPGETFEPNSDLIANPAPPPNPARPRPYGGLIGVATYLKSHPLPAVLLVSGNNHPLQIAALRDSTLRNSGRAIAPAASHWFWKAMRDIQPQAVGVGTQDIHRWLAEMRPEHLIEWLKGGISAGLPFVATNVVVHLTEEHLNLVRNDEHDLALDVPEDRSLGMVDSITIVHPCSVRASVRSAAFSFDAGPKVTAKALTSAEASAEESEATKARRAVLGNECRTTLEFSQRLRPGKTYVLASSLIGPAFRFRLRTHDVLTPHPAWDGLPVAGVTQSGVPMAVMAFLSPSTANGLPHEYFEWTKAEGCPAADCRLEIVDAEDAAREILDAIAPGDGQAPPVLLAISDLAEDETTELLDAIPEIRFLALPPNSARLGRAARPSTPAAGGRQNNGRSYSGDFSFGAVVDAAHPDLTRFMVRPTALGENVHTAIANFGAPAQGRAWEMRNASQWVQPVPGASLTWTSAADGVSYSARLDPARFATIITPVTAEPSVFRPYCSIDADGPFDRVSGERQGDLWTNPVSFAGLVLDDTRRSLGADVALVPASWIDRDMFTAAAVPAATGVPPLSGFILQRVLYRAQRVVRVSVEGSEVAATLKKIIEGAAAAGDGVCVSGLGMANRCPLSEIEVDDLLVNLRKPEAGNYYRIVMPANLARTEGFEFDDSSTRDLIASLDARLSACVPSTSRISTGADDPVAERLENRLAARPQHYLKFDPLAFEFGSTSVNAPGGDTSVFSRLPVDGAGESPSRRIVVDADVNAMLWDTPRLSIRIPAQLRYAQARVDTETSYDQDEFSIGLRIDRKRFPFRWAQIFAGVFADGRLFDQTDAVGVTADGPSLAFTTAPQRNLAGAIGLEIAEHTFGPTTVTGLQFSAFHGRVYNLPVAVQIGDEQFALADFLNSAPIGEVADETPFGFVTATRRQSRLQIEAKTKTTLRVPGFTSVRFSTEHRYRLYHHSSNDTGLFTARTGDTRLALEFGVGKRWSIGPYVERTDITVGIKTGADHHFSVVRWGGQIQIPFFWNGKSVQ